MCVYEDAQVDTDRNTNQIQHMATQWKAPNSRFQPIGFIFLNEMK